MLLTHSAIFLTLAANPLIAQKHVPDDSTGFMVDVL